MARALVQAFVALFAANVAWLPLRAQVAAAAIFGPMSPDAVSEAKGARTGSASDFTLYEVGQGRPKAGRELTPSSIRDTAFPPPAPKGFQAISTTCGTSGQAPPRLLSLHASVGRHAFWPLIANAECRYGLPPGLLDSVVLAESRYNPMVISPAGAAGLAQLMPGTANDLGVVDRFDPNASVQAGARYLRQMLDRFAGNVPLALAAYNAGPGAVDRVRGIPINGETLDYVRRVLAYWTAPGIGPMSPLLSARQTAQMLGFGTGATN